MTKHENIVRKIYFEIFKSEKVVEDALQIQTLPTDGSEASKVHRQLLGEKIANTNNHIAFLNSLINDLIS